MYSKKERERYNEDRKRKCEALGITKNQYNAVRRIGEKLRKAYEDNCNSSFNTEQMYLDTIEPLEQKAEAIMSGLGLFGYFQTDPRGATIYLDVKPIPKNNYTSAYCIY